MHLQKYDKYHEISNHQSSFFFFVKASNVNKKERGPDNYLTGEILKVLSHAEHSVPK